MGLFRFLASLQPAKDNPFQVKCDLCIGIFSNAAHLKKHREDQHYQELGWKQPAKRKPANSNSKLYNERHGLPLLATGKALRTADGITYNHISIMFYQVNVRKGYNVPINGNVSKL